MTLWECYYFLWPYIPLLLRLTASFSDMRFIAVHADDVNIILPRSRVAAVLEFLRGEGPSRGFNINMVKNEAWWWAVSLARYPAVSTDILL